ncbi:MAG: thioredoxin TrxA [Alphaproteobacteria bacterium]
MSTVHVNDDDFETSVFNAEGPVLVDFWAEWCSPCKMIAPSLEEIDNELAGRLTIAKMNVDENPQTPVKYGVRGIPMLMLFKDGQVAGTKIGALPKQQLSQWVNSLL